jgi:hypothetical protein
MLSRPTANTDSAWQENVVVAQLQRLLGRVPAAVPRHQPAVARPECTSTPPGWSSAASRSHRCGTCSVTRRSSRPSATTTRGWRHFKQPSNGWREARRSIQKRKLRTDFQEPFNVPPNRASLNAKTPPRNPLQVTEKSLDGELVPVRGYEKGCSAENVEFVGIAA